MTHSDELDQILNDALAEYREAEPLAGLEDRVLQRLRLQSERRRELWWRWSAITAVAAAAAVVAWIGLGIHTRKEVVILPLVQKQTPLPNPQTRAGDTRAANVQPTHRHSPIGKAHSTRVPSLTQLVPEHAPMREEFPSPAPLQPEERMLLALATSHPEILTDKPGSDKEIVIAPINIAPLTNEAAGNQGEN